MRSNAFNGLRLNPISGRCMNPNSTISICGNALQNLIWTLNYPINYSKANSDLPIPYKLLQRPKQEQEWKRLPCRSSQPIQFWSFVCFRSVSRVWRYHSRQRVRNWCPCPWCTCPRRIERGSWWIQPAEIRNQAWIQLMLIRPTPINFYQIERKALR